MRNHAGLIDQLGSFRRITSGNEAKHDAIASNEVFLPQRGERKSTRGCNTARKSGLTK